MNVTKWVTVAQAAGILGISERSVRRRIAQGSLEAKLENNRRLVKMTADDGLVTASMTLSDKDALIRWLKNELEERNRQIERLQDEIKRNYERSDTIIMRLADELEAQRNILEGKQPKRKRDDSFWRRLRRLDAGDDG